MSDKAPTPIITELLNTPDNIEIIRDHLAAVLSLELENQHRLAVDAQEANATDYDIPVYLENEEPWQLLQGDDNPFSLVNVSLQSTAQERGSTAVDKRKMKATFFVDCYATGNSSPDGKIGATSIKRAWFVGRLVRNILSAGDDTYLKLRGIVGTKSIVKMETAYADSVSAIKVCVCRIQVDIGYDEKSPQVMGVQSDPMTVQVTDKDGRVLIDM